MLLNGLPAFYFPLAFLDVELHPKCRIRETWRSTKLPLLFLTSGPTDPLPTRLPPPGLKVSLTSEKNTEDDERKKKGGRGNLESEKHESVWMVKVAVTFCLAGD